MKIAIILGTRPEIIKLSSIIRYCENNRLDYFMVHTNQHYSENISKVFFDDLKLPSPKYNLNVGSGLHGYQTAKMLERTESILIEEKPDFVLVQGDTNSALAGALAASKLNIPIGHVEAGLRSYDMSMPEEKNRIMVDHISDFLFCPSNLQENILLKENISQDKIFVVGNVIVDALLWAKNNESKILKKLNLGKNEFILLTIHRPENVDDEKRLRLLLGQIEKLGELKKKIIFPIHPRTKNQLLKFSIELPSFIETIDPIGFLDMVTLEKNAKIIFTDSGGVQEESCILKTPCVTLRTSTERPETINVGANKLNSDDLISDYIEMTSRSNDWKNPFGNGKSGENIILSLIVQKAKPLMIKDDQGGLYPNKESQDEY